MRQAAETISERLDRFNGKPDHGNECQCADCEPFNIRNTATGKAVQHQQQQETIAATLRDTPATTGVHTATPCSYCDHDMDQHTVRGYTQCQVSICGCDYIDSSPLPIPDCGCRVGANGLIGYCDVHAAAYDTKDRLEVLLDSHDKLVAALKAVKEELELSMMTANKDAVLAIARAALRAAEGGE